MYNFWDAFDEINPEQASIVQKWQQIKSLTHLKD